MTWTLFYSAAQSSALKKKLIDWNEKTKFFVDDDLVLFDHADNVMSGKNFYKLRICEIQHEVEVIGNIQWFPWSRLDTAYS